MSNAKRKNLSQTARRRIYEKTNGICAYCGTPLAFNSMTVDHVYPLHLGGADAENNMLPACRRCNHRKSTLTVDKFREQIQRSLQVLGRKSTYCVAVKYGMLTPRPEHKVVFYFERQTAREDERTTEKEG